MCCHLIRHSRHPVHHTSQGRPSPSLHREVLTAPLPSKGSWGRRGRIPCWARWWRWVRFWTHNFASDVLACLMKDINSADKIAWHQHCCYHTLHSSDDFLQQHWNPSLRSLFACVRVRKVEQKNYKDIRLFWVMGSFFPSKSHCRLWIEGVQIFFFFFYLG